VSIDLIFGLPDHLGRDWLADLRKVVELSPEHVSLYGLTAEPGAPLGRRVAEGRERLADEDRYADEYLLAHETLTAAGYEHYEVSNFARPGYRSRHNSIYWTGAPYAAAGPGAHSFAPPLRRWNVRSWAAYRELLEAGLLPVDDEEAIGETIDGLERIWLGLRTSDGLPLGSNRAAELRLVEGWVAGGLASLSDEHVRLTPEGWLLLDRLAVDLDGARHGTSAGSKTSAIDGKRPLVQISANSNPTR
jgi:oxygen-independent coproporphyrinogen III oxidase